MSSNHPSQTFRQFQADALEAELKEIPKTAYTQEQKPIEPWPIGTWAAEQAIVKRLLQEGRL
jgi:hypothetical protein